MLMLLCTRAVRRFIFIVIYYETFDMATLICGSELNSRVDCMHTKRSRAIHTFSVCSSFLLKFSSRNFCWIFPAYWLSFRCRNEWKKFFFLRLFKRETCLKWKIIEFPSSRLVVDTMWKGREEFWKVENWHEIKWNLRELSSKSKPFAASLFLPPSQ